MAAPFRFGIQMHRPLEGRTWLDSARIVEDLGFSTMFMPDHFTDQWAPLVGLTAAASVTTTLKVGALVFGNDYRHPVVLAKEIATLDNISEGRVEFGLGAGWMRTDYDEAGMAYDRPSVRIDRLEESIEIIRKCWAGEPFSFEGDHYTITEYDAHPRPYTPDGPPIIIGGGGPRMLGVATRNADIVAITANLRAGVVGPDATADSMPEAYDAKIARVRDVAGDGLDAIELSSLTMTSVFTEDRSEALKGVAELFGSTPDLVAQSPALLVGSPAQIAETLLERRERWGFSYVVVQDDGNHEQFSQVIAQLAGT